MKVLASIVVVGIDHPHIYIARQVYQATTEESRNWGLTLDQLCIYFRDRISPSDIE